MRNIQGMKQKEADNMKERRADRADERIKRQYEENYKKYKEHRRKVKDLVGSTKENWREIFSSGSC